MLVTTALPSVVAAILLAGQARTLAERASTAETVEFHIDQAVALGSMVTTLEGERGVSAGLVSLDTMGLSNSGVAETTGYDLDTEIDLYREELDRDLAAIDLAVTSSELRLLLADLQGVRQAVDVGEISGEQTTSYYQRIFQLATEQSERMLSESAARLGELDAVHLATSIETIGDLNEVSATSAQWIGLAYVESFLPNADDAIVLAGQAEALDTTIAEIDARTPPLSDLPEWHSIRDASDRRMYVTHLLSRTSPVADRASTVALLSEIGPREAQRSEQLEAVADDLRQRIHSELEAIADRAKLFGYGAAGTSIVFLLLLAWSSIHSVRTMARSIGALRERAERISGGAFDGPHGASPRDPAETAIVHESLDHMVGVLQRIRDQALALAEGDLDAKVLGEAARGPIGQAFAGSIDRLRRTTVELRDSEKMARTVIDAASESIVIVDGTGRVLHANQAALAHLGDLLRPGQAIASALADWRSLVGTTKELEIDACGRKRSVLASASQFPTDNGPVSVLIWRDITQRKADEEQMRHLAHHDSLTGLLNRAGMKRALQRRAEDGLPVSLVYLDLDNFKLVNDLYGHETGDVVLTEIARRLSMDCRDADQVARIGGDEFVILSDAPGDDVSRLADRLVEAARQPILLPNGGFHQLGASAGWATGDGSCSGEILRRADVALFAAKSSDDGSVVAFDDEIAQLDEARRRTEADLSGAVDNDELLLFGQPIVDLQSGEVVGVEALVRWQHPERGLLRPISFIPVAERSDLILDVDRWVLRAAVEHAARHPDLPRLSVNVSGRFLRRDDFVPYVLCLLETAGLDPGRLQIEITETHRGIDTDVAADSTRRLKECGVRLALDDFGTGYSSLTHLLRMPVDVIKIDRSMVARLDSPEGLGVVDAIIGYGAMRGLDVVAEGVETHEQAEVLRDRGCRYGQGYLFSEPVPICQVMAPIGQDSMTTSA